MVDKALFDAYKAALNAVAGLAEADLGRLMGQCARLSLDGVRDLLKRGYPALVSKYGDIAAAAALDFYRQSRALAGAAGDFAPTMPEAVAACVGDVGYHMGAQYKSGALDARLLQSALTGALDRRVLGQADAAIVGNAMRDPAKPKWAIIPHAGACGWCVMLGSLGFNYSSSGTAGVSRHDHCKCAVAVDFDTANPKLEGYDPDALYDAYKDARDTALPDAERRWDAMTDEQREEYRARPRGKRGSMSAAKDRFKRRAIVDEMNRRDRAWLQDPKTPVEWKALDGATPTPEEIGTARALGAHGYRVEFRPTQDFEMKRTSDVFRVHGKSGAEKRLAVEFRRPTGGGSQTVFHQYEEAAGQAHALVLDARNMGMPDKKVLDDAARKLHWHYKVRRGLRKGESWGYDECVVVLEDGSIRTLLK